MKKEFEEYKEFKEVGPALPKEFDIPFRSRFVGFA